MKKRIISFILVIVTVVLSLASCGYSLATDENLADYVTYDKAKFDAIFKNITIEDGDFTSNEETRLDKVADFIYDALVEQSSTDKLTEGTVDANDVLNYCYYAVIEKDGKTVVVNTSYMAVAKAVSANLGYTKTGSSDIEKALTAHLGAAGLKIEDFLYTTKTSGNVKGGELAYISYVKTNTEKADDKTTYSYVPVELKADSTTNGVHQLIVDKLLPIKADPDKNITAKDGASIGSSISSLEFTQKEEVETDDGKKEVEYKYTGITVNWVLEKAEPKNVKVEVELTDKKTTFTGVDGATYDLKKGDKVTYYVYPVSFRAIENITPKTIIETIYAASITTETLDCFEKCENEIKEYKEKKTAYDKLVTEYDKLDEAHGKLETELTTLETSLKTLESDLKTLEEKHAELTDETEKAESQKKIDAKKEEITKKNEDITAKKKAITDKKTEADAKKAERDIAETASNGALYVLLVTAVGTEAEKNLIKPYNDSKAAYDAAVKDNTDVDAKKTAWENAFKPLAEALENGDAGKAFVEAFEDKAYELLLDEYNAEYKLNLAEAIWTAMKAATTVTSYPEKTLVREIYEIKYDAHERAFYANEGVDDDADSHYKEHGGKFEEYLMEVTGKKTNFQAAKDALWEEARLLVADMIRVYYMAKEYDQIADKAAIKEYKKTMEYKSYSEAHGKSNALTAYQFDLLMDYFLTEVKDEDGEVVKDEKTGVIKYELFKDTVITLVEPAEEEAE